MGSMRFMLRGRTESGGAGASAPASAPPAAAAAAPPPGAPRLLPCVRDSFSTAVPSLEISLMDSGGMVSGRRSCGGANRAIEDVARGAYAAQGGPGEDFTEQEMAESGLAGERLKKRALQQKGAANQTGAGKKHRKK